jgi:hypothetical protein
MEGWRQRRLGSKTKNPAKKNKTVLTRTGLLMEGLGRNLKTGKSHLASVDLRAGRVQIQLRLLEVLKFFPQMRLFRRAVH